MKLLGLSEEAARRAVEEGSVTVVQFGLGKLGLPLAVAIARAGARVVGVDVNRELVDSINMGENPLAGEPGLSELIPSLVEEGRLRATTDWRGAVEEGDVYVVAVPVTVYEDMRPRLDILFDVAEKISLGLEKGDLVSIETTLPLGTTRRVSRLLEERSGLAHGVDFGVVHAPERTSSGRMLRDITESYPKVLGSDSEAALEAAAGFYSAVNKRGIVRVSSSVAAEAVKVFEGIYRYVNIALANELALYAEQAGFDVWEVIEAANTQPYCHLHKPGAGVGGHCIPVYPRFVMYDALRRGFEARVLDASRRVNDAMPGHAVSLLTRALNEVGKPVKGSRVLLVGLTYRPHVREYFMSPAIPIARELREMGAILYAYEPAALEEDYGRLGVAKWGGESVDAVLVLSGYREFAELLYRGGVRAAVVVDARGIVDRGRAEEAGFLVYRLGEGGISK